MSKQDLFNYLASFGQQHILEFWDDLDNSQQESLLQDIKKLNLSQLNLIFEQSTRQQPSKQTCDMDVVPDELKGIN